MQFNGAAASPTATFTYNEKNPAATGRVPTTLCAVVTALPNGVEVVALWRDVRGSTVVIDSPATLTAITQ